MVGLWCLTDVARMRNPPPGDGCRSVPMIHVRGLRCVCYHLLQSCRVLPLHGVAPLLLQVARNAGLLDRMHIVAGCQAEVVGGGDTPRHSNSLRPPQGWQRLLFTQTMPSPRHSATPSSTQHAVLASVHARAASGEHASMPSMAAASPRGEIAAGDHIIAGFGVRGRLRGLHASYPHHDQTVG